jgi:hypothetical protein
MQAGKKGGAGSESPAALPVTAGQVPEKRKDYTDEERAALEAKLPKPAQKLEIPFKEGMDYLQAVSEQVHDPTSKAAVISNRVVKPELGELDLMATIRTLRAQVAEVQAGDMSQADRMLVAQAYTLDAIFSECLRMWLANQFTHHGVGQEYLKMAFKAQGQARCTWESLSKIKNPASPTFVRQANIANGPQQVNNGVSDSTTPASAPTPVREIENQPNELMGECNVLDTRAPEAAVAGDTAMGSVGKGHRSKDG